ncbi:hypothetical protein [uncultured Planktosalinus sp.]|uniref:hypothetical protein n=1 Tax=uncultured Planktosalinus sp. TaxID=1810935 RepID=UPI0030DB713E
MNVLPSLEVEAEPSVSTGQQRKQEMKLGLCVACDLRFNCVWLSENKQFCEHYK